MNIELSLSSRNYPEWQTYIVFEYLMKSIVGRYMLNGDNEKEYSRLPKDFIDLENKVIIWHSDSGTDNFLRLEYTENRTIKIAIQKCKDSKEHYTNSVRIRTSGSEYKYYYEDIGLRNARLNFRQLDDGHIMENIIWMVLMEKL